MLGILWRAPVNQTKHADHPRQKRTLKSSKTWSRIVLCSECRTIMTASLFIKIQRGSTRRANHLNSDNVEPGFWRKMHLIRVPSNSPGLCCCNSCSSSHSCRAYLVEGPRRGSARAPASKGLARHCPAPWGRHGSIFACLWILSQNAHHPVLFTADELRPCSQKTLLKHYTGHLP